MSTGLLEQRAKYPRSQNEYRLGVHRTPDTRGDNVKTEL